MLVSVVVDESLSLRQTDPDDLRVRGITTAIDSQGSTNEQSTAYAQFNYSLWGRAADVLRACGAVRS